MSGAVVVTRFQERFTKCNSCRSDARWMVNGTTTCDRHRALWEHRAAEAAAKAERETEAESS